MTQKIEPSKPNPNHAASNAAPDAKWQQLMKPETKKIVFADLSKKLSDAEKVKLITKDAIAKYWPILVKKHPAAFKNNPNLKKTIPEVIFINTPQELYKIDPSQKGKESWAFVSPNLPNTIYVYMPTSIDALKNLGANQISANAAHEMVHSITNASFKRINADKVCSGTYRDVNRDVIQTITLPALTREGEKLTFTVADLLQEGVAESDSIQTTGIDSKNTYYQPYREITAKLISRVTRKTYNKAMFENDATAYQTVVKAAVILKQEYDMAHKEATENPAKFWIKTNLEKIGL
jgi:hypothetical protein